MSGYNLLSGYLNTPAALGQPQLHYFCPYLMQRLLMNIEKDSRVCFNCLDDTSEASARLLDSEVVGCVHLGAVLYLEMQTPVLRRIEKK